MAVRRVVTGQAGEKAVIVDDAAIEPITTELVPGFASHEVWKVDGTATVPAADAPSQAGMSYYPPVNGVRFQVLTVPPEGAPAAENVDGAAELARLDRVAPGIMDPNDPDNPGMHATDTVDYVYVAEGDVWLDLDDGEEIELHAGDTVVQQGTRHAWRNRSDRPCVIVGVVVGAVRS